MSTTEGRGGTRAAPEQQSDNEEDEMYAHPWIHARCYFVSDAIRNRLPSPDRFACSRSSGAVLCDGCRTERQPVATT